jgi:hypothetical protein
VALSYARARLCRADANQESDLERDQQKVDTTFAVRSRDTKDIERDGDSTKSNLALDEFTAELAQRRW